MDDNSIMPFGKYKGEKMANVPADYLVWLYDEKKLEYAKNVKAYVAENIDCLKSEIELKQKSK